MKSVFEINTQNIIKSTHLMRREDVSKAPASTLSLSHTDVDVQTSHTHPVWWPCTVGFAGHLPLNQNFQETDTSPLSSLVVAPYCPLPDTCQRHKHTQAMISDEILKLEEAN